MISDSQFDELVSTYKQYEWLLRRVVVSPDAVPPSNLTADVEIENGTVDAAWFSREPTEGEIAWEVRYLGPTQYALVEHLDEDSPDFEEKLRETEARLADAVAAKRFA